MLQGEELEQLLDPTGYVYVVSSRDVPFRFKIGYCKSLSAGSRIRTLQIGSPVVLEEVAGHAAERSLEKELHDALSEYRIHGEWFELPASALAPRLPPYFFFDAQKWEEVQEGARIKASPS